MKVSIYVTRISRGTENYPDEFESIWGLRPRNDEAKPEVRYISSCEIREEHFAGVDCVVIKGYEYILEDEIAPKVAEVWQTIKGKDPTADIVLFVHGGGRTSRERELRDALIDILGPEEIDVYDYGIGLGDLPSHAQELVNRVKKILSVGD